MNNMKLVFLGPPGAGKGTQAKLLAQNKNIPHISTGQIFRDNIQNKTKLGAKAQAFNDKGILVPDEITNEMVKLRLTKDDCEKGYILDGYPRTVPQAEFLDSIVNIDRVVCFYLSDDEAMKRMMGRAVSKPGRADDNEEVIKTRIKQYEQKTKPLIDFYKDKENLLMIDANPEIEVIQKDVIDKLNQ